MEGFLESYISLVIDSNDQPHIVYVDSGDDSTEYDDNVLKYAYMENGAWQTEVVFSGKVDAFLSLALDSNDLPHIVFVYRDTDSSEVNDNDLKYAHFDGSSWQFETVAANVGKSYNSIAVDSNDNVCISFCTYKYSGGPATQVDLKVAYLCSDEDGDGYSPEGGACGLEDCDDSIAFLNPGQDELCSDGLDNNCNGRIDEDCSSPIEMQCIDGDGDGYYLNALGCGERDCDDEAAAAYPGAQEICDDDLDNDCDGDVDNYDDDCRSDCSYLDSACVTGAYNTDIKKCVREYASAGTACGDGLEC
ncbi:MAG: hypothetical protein GY868_06370, partial [Deltaproteobacteria bacterium]|nr:hypothetical protein [Deltaproteobacteria bacterium]